MGKAKTIALGLLKFFIIIVSLITLSVISALITMRLVGRADLVKLPSLIGKDTIYALEQLNKIGLRMKVTGQEFSVLVPENHIIDQEPKPFEVIRRDRAVKVVLSKGAEKVDVPKVIDEPWLRAQNLLQKAGLKIGRLARVYHDSVEKNRVIAQNPSGNSMVSRGTGVDLLLSDGKPPKYMFMPGLKGLNLNAALKRLSASELQPGNITYSYNANVPPNRVMSQSVAFGFRVVAGEKIDLELSKAERPDQEEAGIYTTLHYRVPQGLEKREVVILLEEGEKTREIFHQLCSPLEDIDLLIKTSRNTKARIFLDNELVEERQF